MSGALTNSVSEPKIEQLLVLSAGDVVGIPSCREAPWVAPKSYLPSGVVDANSAAAAMVSRTTGPKAAVDGLSASPDTTRA
jgi:hypothetical protein